MLDSKLEIYSLPQLQDRIKRDPSAYLPEFDLQLQHFYSTLDIFKLNPQNIPKEIFQLMIFIAQTLPYYSKYGVCNKFIDKLVDELKNNSTLMTSDMRITMATSLILLSNQKILDIIFLLPLWFDLMRLPDKVLRTKLLKHIVSSIVSVNSIKNNRRKNKNKSKLILKSKKLNMSFSILGDNCLNSDLNNNNTEKIIKNYNISIGYDLNKYNSTIISFLTERIADSRDIVRSITIIIEIYRQNIWNNAKIINIIADCCIKQTSSKVALISANFLLGKNWSISDLEDDLSDDEKKELEEEATKAMKSALINISSNARKKKLEKAKLAMKRIEKNRNNKESNSLIRSNQCIDMIHNPQDYTEELFKRVTKHIDPFEVRLTLISLISRLIERHKLIIINYYSFLGRYLSPNNRNVTNILAYLAQACHELIPPQELSSIIKILMDNFVNECCRPEIITIGLNTIREICQRIPLVLDKDKLLDLSNFRNMKNKGISIAAKSLINLYREIMPDLLHKSLLNKEAALNIKEGKVNNITYGDKKIDTNISGIDLLIKYNKKINKREYFVNDSKTNKLLEFDHNIQKEDELNSINEINEDELNSINDIDEDELSSINDIDEDELSSINDIDEDELSSIDDIDEDELSSIIDIDEDELNSINNNENKLNEENNELKQSNNLLKTNYKLDENSQLKYNDNNLVMDKILDQDDFKLIKKLKTRVEATKTLGIKNQDNLELSITSSDELSSNSEEEFYSEESTDQDISKEIKSQIVKNINKKKQNKQQRIQSILRGREDRESFTEKRKRESLNKKQSIPQSVQSRNKPMMMVIKKRGINKKNQTSNMKIKNIKAHIRNLKKDTGGKKRFRKR